MDLLPIINTELFKPNVIVDKELNKKRLQNLLRVRREIRKLLKIDSYPYVLNDDSVLTSPQSLDILIFEIMAHYLQTGEVKVYSHKAI